MPGLKKKKSQCEWQNLWESQTVLAKMDIFFCPFFKNPFQIPSKKATVTDFVTNLFFCCFFCEHNFFSIFKKYLKGFFCINTYNTKMSQKIPSFFCCKICDYNTISRKDFNKHLLTRKHKIIQDNTEKSQKIPNKKYSCECGKYYKYHSGLYNHKKTCNLEQNVNLTINENNYNEENKLIIIPNNELKDTQINKLTEMVKDLLKQNTELVQTIKEMTPKVGNTTINNTTNNNFNLNVFLNETCKDAINMSDFIKTIKFTEDDLENSRINGGISTLSNVMIKGLQKLDITKRPVHCTDAKRETLYIREKEKWEKDENHERMMDALGDIAQKQREFLWEWSDANPESQDVMHPLNDIFHLTNIKVLDPLTKKEEQGKKFIRNISKEVVIDKSEMK